MAAGRIRCSVFFVAAAAACVSAGVRAEVVQQRADGFVVRTSAETGASVSDAWGALIAPATWWNSAHTFSGDSANLTLNPLPGGCFCEVLPAAGSGNSQPSAGGVEHMRVVYAEPARVLRLVGGLGPLQSEAVHGTWTITLKPTEKGSRVLFEYVVGGFMRYSTDQIAPIVDKMMMEQLTRLVIRLGPVAAASKAKSPVSPARAAPPVRGVPAVVPMNGSKLAAAIDSVMNPQKTHGGAEAAASANASDTQAKVSAQAVTPAKGSGSVEVVKKPEGAAIREVVPPRVSSERSSPLGASAIQEPVTQGYVQRNFLVQLDGGEVLLAPIGEEVEPIIASFGAAGLADKIRWTARNGAAESIEERALHCLCTGTYMEERGVSTFKVIDAVLEWR